MMKFSAYIKFFAVLVFVGVASVIAAESLDTVNRAPLPEWQWKVGADGELSVTLAGNTYRLSTRLSHPNMGPDDWYKIPGRPVKVGTDGAVSTLDFACEYYTLHRTVEKQGHRLVVRDTFRNVSKEEQAIAFNNVLTPSQRSEKDHIYLAGCLKPGSAPEPASPAQNSSIYFDYPESSLAMVLEDDFYRLQAALLKQPGRAVVQNKSFGLAPNDSYTFEYSFYPIGKGDYWDFINLLRDDWKINSTLEGNLLFSTCPHPQPASYMPDTLKNAMVNYLGAKYVCGTNYTWLGQPSFWLMPGSKGFMAEYGSREQQLEKLKHAIKNAATFPSEISIVAKIQTVFGAAPQPNGEPLPNADSVIIDANGKPKCRPSKSKDGKVVGTVNMHYPMIGNSYNALLIDLINMAMDAGIKNVYFDTFCYSFWDPYGRWTYDRWDGRSIDMDPKTWTIARKKADLAVLVSDAQVAFNELIRKRGGRMFFNSTPTTRKQMSLLATCTSFTEATPSQLPITQHASHPVNLGYYPGYQYRKDAWKTPKDYYENVMENLEYGCLTYIYWMVGQLPTAPTIYQRMYPVTVKKLYRGCVEGEERIITKRSGRYTFGTNAEPKIYIYDKDGTESAPTEEQARFETVDGKLVVILSLPEGGAAVLEKQVDVRDGLAKELEF